MFPEALTLEIFPNGDQIGGAGLFMQRATGESITATCVRYCGVNTTGWMKIHEVKFLEHLVTISHPGPREKLCHPNWRYMYF